MEKNVYNILWFTRDEGIQINTCIYLYYKWKDKSASFVGRFAYRGRNEQVAEIEAGLLCIYLLLQVCSKKNINVLHFYKTKFQEAFPKDRNKRNKSNFKLRWQVYIQRINFKWLWNTIPWLSILRGCSQRIKQFKKILEPFLVDKILIDTAEL